MAASNHPTVSRHLIINNLNALERYLEEHSGSAAAASQFQHLKQALNDNTFPDRVPIELVSQSVNTAAQLLQQPNLGLSLVNYIRPMRHIMSLFANEFSLRFPDYLTLISRYISIATEILQPKINSTREFLIYELNPTSPETISYHQIECFTAFIHQAVVNIPNAKIARIEFAHSPPSSDLGLYQQKFGLIPDFEQTNGPRIFFLPETKKATFGTGKDLKKSLKIIQTLEAQHSKVKDEEFIERCHSVLKTLLYLGVTSKQELASVLCMSPRTLQRKLTAANTTFRDLLQQVRIDLATHYFDNPDLTATEICFALGYQDYSQFHRAFKTWFGHSPEQYRKNLNAE